MCFFPLCGIRQPSTLTMRGRLRFTESRKLKIKIQIADSYFLPFIYLIVCHLFFFSSIF